MKNFILALIILISTPTAVMSRDYVVDFLSENYQEETDDFKHHLQIYHSIEINSIAGRKILIVKGKNYRYRTWLREYIAKTNKMIIKIPDDNNSDFISSKAFLIDVTAIYPVNEKFWKNNGLKTDLKAITGEKHILIVDKNIKRQKLLKQIVTDLGYPVTCAMDSKEALILFKVQPDSFLLVIANYGTFNLKKAQFIKQIAILSPATPVIIGGTYNNKNVNDKLSKDFANLDNVIVRSIILKDLSRTIINILNQDARI